MNKKRRIIELEMKLNTANSSKGNSGEKLVEFLDGIAAKHDHPPEAPDWYAGQANATVAALAFKHGRQAPIALKERVNELSTLDGTVGKLFQSLKESLQ